jgi:hypothetical protein
MFDPSVERFGGWILSKPEDVAASDPGETAREARFGTRLPRTSKHIPPPMERVRNNLPIWTRLTGCDARRDEES